MRIALTVSYDGKDYCGWQVQPNGISVQQTLEDAVLNLTGEKVRVTGSGRTDAGVHAEGQVAHFDTLSTIPPQRFYLALNSVLPSTVRVLNSRAVEDDFNACRSAKKKTYRYSFYRSEVELPLKEPYATRIDGSVDLQKMKEACKCFVGTKDFECVSSTGKQVKTTVRTVFDCSIEEEGVNLYLTITGDGFLYNMVRIIAGTLLEVGKNTKTTADIEKMFAEGKRELGGKTLSAKGLCLVKVEYQ